MTQKRAERLTGYEVRLLSSDSNWVRFGAFDGPKLVAEASGEVEWLASRTWSNTCTRSTPGGFWSGLACGAPVVSGRIVCRSITGATARMAAPMKWRTRKRCAGTAIG